MDLMDNRAHEASRGGHLPEGVGAVVGPLMVIVRAVNFEICPPSCSDEFGVFPKASQWLSLRSLTRGLPSFCLWWDHSSGVMSSPTASSSSGLGVVSSWSDEQDCHLVPVGGSGISDTVGGEAVDIGSLPTVASWRVVASIPKMVASGTLLVSSYKGYISTPWALGGQACKTAPQTSTNAWWAYPSSAIASCSNSNMLSLWDCSKVQAWMAWQASASLVVPAQQTSASF